MIEQPLFVSQPHVHLLVLQVGRFSCSATQRQPWQRAPGARTQPDAPPPRPPCHGPASSVYAPWGGGPGARLACCPSTAPPSCTCLRTRAGLQRPAPCCARCARGCSPSPRSWGAAHPPAHPRAHLLGSLAVGLATACSVGWGASMGAVRGSLRWKRCSTHWQRCCS